MFAVLALAPGPPAFAGAAVGEQAPAFTLVDREGRPHALSELRGRVVVVDFWASWCLPCREALPALDAIARRHRATGVVVLAVGIDTDVAAAERFVAERLPATAMTLLQDPGGTVLARYGAGGMPALFVVDGEGVVRIAEAGYAPARLVDVERRLTLLAAGAAGAAGEGLRPAPSPTPTGG